MEVYKTYFDFEKRILSLYTQPTVRIRVSQSPMNKKILQSLHFDTDVLQVVSILTTICQAKLNSDFILTSLYSSISRKSLYYLYVENEKIVAFCILGKENKRDFQNNIDVQQLKQYLSEQDLPYPNLLHIIQGSHYVAYSISILCSCKKGKGKQLMDEIPSSMNEQSFVLTVDSPLKELKRYYQSLGFIYEKNLYDWSGTIYKVIEK